MNSITRNSLGLALVAALVIFGLGCGSGDGKQPPSDPTKDPKAAKDGEKTKHEDWWCDEHGIPEDECSMCSAKVAKECKAKGDWCDKHERAKSQCFICDPSLKEKYAAKYRAKYGTEPPPIEDEKKDEKK